MGVSQVDLLIEGASELATATGPGPFAGTEQGAVETIERASVAIEEGRIHAVGPAGSLADLDAEQVLDASGGTVVPGFVDAHTHLVFGGDRADELVMKLEGASYEEILAEGGGIHSTVRATRGTGAGALADGARSRLDGCLAAGTTTLEAKSGYALTVEGELELLRVLASVDEQHPVDVVSTLLGAHAVPEGTDRSAFLDEVVGALTPQAADAGIASFCDAFVDEGAFTVEEGRRILEAGRQAGLGVRIHADELSCTRAGRLGLELDAASIDHVNRIDPADVQAWEARPVDQRPVATLCPVTPFTTESIPYAPARELIEAGIPVGLGSDLNPNAYSEGMWFTLALAVHAMRMTPSEALVAATANSARSLGLDDRGRLEEGLLADLVVLDVPSHEHIGYRMGQAPVRAVVKEGKILADAGSR